MRHVLSSAVLLGILSLAGCNATSSPVVGTWEGRATSDEAPFSFGAVTFAPDGTFTAEAKYGDTTRAVSGRYTTEGEQITLAGQGIPPRVYQVSTGDDTAVFTDQTTGKSMTLDRFK
ncbi:MAG: hypothetical protein GWP75_12360 [Planctomycetia bacterium]|jgi:hypothetical protein|nr:hypothetical protein [Planctomycetia bacterium]